MWDLIAGFFIIAIVFMLVRPNSPGAKAVQGFSDTLSNLIATAVGETLTVHHSDGSAVTYGYTGNFLSNPSA